MDVISQQRIETTHPAVRADLLSILRECDTALTGRATVRLTETTRTFGYQDGLYALGRTKINPNGKSASRPLGYKVTNAQGGYSIHNFGLAVDFCLIIDGKQASWDDVKDWDDDGKADWMEVVAIFERHGWTWGGRWSSFIDKPHFEKTFGHTLQKLRALYASKTFITGTSFVDLLQVSSTHIRETTARVNFRKGPGTEYLVIETLDRRTEVVVVGTKDGWSQVSKIGSNKTGWVSNKYLK